MSNTNKLCDSGTVSLQSRKMRITNQVVILVLIAADDQSLLFRDSSQALPEIWPNEQHEQDEASDWSKSEK
jgi:hypothetical protein